MLTKVQAFVGSINCTKYESCFNTSIYFSDNNGFGCQGAQSCMDSKISANSLYCNGYSTCSGQKSTVHSTNDTNCFGGNSCFQNNITSKGQIGCAAYNTCSNSHVQLTSYLNPLWECTSTHSCCNSIFQSKTSFSDKYDVNTRLIYMYFNGVFGGYNTTIYNNENNVYIWTTGYYSLYGLTLYCTSLDSICVVNCYGNGCVGLTLICGDSVSVCQYKCQDKECQSYKHLIKIYNNSDNNHNTMRKIDSNPVYDEMAVLVNNILIHYNKNFSLFPDGRYSNIDLIESNDYCTLFYGDYLQVYDTTLIVNENEHICCLGALSCNNVTIKPDFNESGTIIYCAGVYSCNNAIFHNVDSVYSLGLEAFYGSIVDHFDGIVICSASYSCAYSYISNGSVVICMSLKACFKTTMTNVQTVIAMGSGSLCLCQLIDVERIMLLSSDALSDTIISNAEMTMNNLELYCQNDNSMCYEIENITGIQLYCYDKTNISINIDKIDFHGENISNLLYCSANSYSPSISPTVSPTKSQFTHDIDLIVSWLETSTVEIGIILAISTIIIVFLSIYFRRKKHSQTLKIYNQFNYQSTGMTLFNDMNNNENDSNCNDDDDDNNSNIMTYLKGFGHKASHLVIVQVIFEIYDVFVDISYLLELYHNNLLQYFVIFLSSCILTLVINSIILLYFLKNSFQYNKLFEQWFWNHSAIIISLMIFCLFTDVGMIISLFTSQIFGHLIFYAPLKFNDIKTMKSSLILSIFIEHLPQLIVQCLVFFNQSQSSWTTISITSLGVTCIDTFITCIKIVIWFVIMKQIKNG